MIDTELDDMDARGVNYESFIDPLPERSLSFKKEQPVTARNLRSTNDFVGLNTLGQLNRQSTNQFVSQGQLKAKAVKVLVSQ